MDTSSPSPEYTPATSDPGDEIARRYRYQWAFAAIACCALFDDTSGVAEVFCEHHEDVLLKHTDGTYSGIQIKTRDSNQDPWKANEATVIDACAKFVCLEDAFPQRFRSFRFLTNHPLHSAKNSRDLAHVLKVIKDAPTIGDLPGPVASWLRRVARTACCSDIVAFATLSKTNAMHDLPKLQDISTRLIETVTESWPKAADCSYHTVSRAANDLVAECGRASSLAHDDVLPAYVAALPDSEDIELQKCLDGKRMTLNRVVQALDRGIDIVADLDGDPSDCVGPGDGSTDLMLKKLDAGGFSAVSLTSAEDLRDKAEYLGISWTKRHGKLKGLQRYGHIRTLVLSDAARAFEATTTPDDNFGPAMREALRARFRERRSSNDRLYECADEHLEGVAYSLTAECKVVWSNTRPWEDD